MAPSIEKQQFRNNLNGYVGVVVISPKGEDRGASVEPGGTVWLSEAEQTLTANAPRDPKDNPFIPQTWPVEDPETGVLTNVTITPLTPVNEGRFTPAQMRYIPGVEGEGARGVALAQAATHADEPVVVTVAQEGVLRREAEVNAVGDAAQPNHPPAPPAAAAAAHAAAARAKAEAEERAAQEAAQDAAQGALPPDPVRAPPPPVMAPPAPPVPPQRPDDPGTPSFNEETGDWPAPSKPGRPEKGKEETAAKVDAAVGEETGAAPPPTGDAPEGSYTASEEVGTPAAASQPPPYTPPEE